MPTSASSTVRKLFDYDSLNAEDAVFVQQQTGAIRLLMKRSAQDIVEIGQRLIEVKQRLGHGRFGTWLGTEFEWTQETARRFMKVAKQFAQNPQIVDFAPSALYLLAEPSTPESARKEALSRADSGESITYTAAKNIKQKYSPSPKKESDAPASPVSQTRLEVDNRQKLVSTRDAPTPPQANTSQVDISSSARVADPAEPPTARPPLPTALPSSQAPSPSATEPTTTAIRPTTPTIKPGSDSPWAQQTPTTNSPTQVSSTSSAPPRQRATDQARPRLEIMAIRPKEVDLEVSEEGEVEATTPQRRTPKFVQPGTWWQFGEQHLLYCGDPASPRFRERLPDKIALSLAFPPTPSWQLGSLSCELRSALALFTRHQDNQDLELFREMIERSLLLYTWGREVVVFSFLPDPEILMLAHNLECRWFCAEPDALKCEGAIGSWRGKGFRAEKVSGLRF